MEARRLFNYLPPLLVEYLVYGPWKDPGSLGWPATVTFPDVARLSTHFDTGVNAGLLIGVVLVTLALLATTRARAEASRSRARARSRRSAGGSRFAPGCS